MKVYEFVIFLILDIIVHDLVVKWEIRSNIDLFEDIEVPYKWRKKKK